MRLLWDGDEVCCWTYTVSFITLRLPGWKVGLISLGSALVGFKGFVVVAASAATGWSSKIYISQCVLDSIVYMCFRKEDVTNLGHEKGDLFDGRTPPTCWSARSFAMDIPSIPTCEELCSDSFPERSVGMELVARVLSFLLTDLLSGLWVSWVRRARRRELLRFPSGVVLMCWYIPMGFPYNVLILWTINTTTTLDIYLLLPSAYLQIDCVPSHCLHVGLQ